MAKRTERSLSQDIGSLCFYEDKGVSLKSLGVFQIDSIVFFFKITSLASSAENEVFVLFDVDSRHYGHFNLCSSGRWFWMSRTSGRM
ncbi:hypothetical protein NPIL_669091 [Nephila pilipes]|uniref:Uncharacterized protein n=1 Tax=Nephila pilipes TaxID=299642 RepID=A0A8X6K966_NEPPI|nr:hypothetical protein NPIL_669091 [Nephila pilipes]